MAGLDDAIKVYVNPFNGIESQGLLGGAVTTPGGAVNPFNGIERSGRLSPRRPLGGLGIHSMELKDIILKW